MKKRLLPHAWSWGWRFRTAKPWTVVAKGEVDNNKLTTAGETVTFPLLPGTFYALQFVGDAHALDPKAASVRVDVQVEVDGGHPVPLGGPKQVEQSSAGLRGAAFFHT